MQKKDVHEVIADMVRFAVNDGYGVDLIITHLDCDWTSFYNTFYELFNEKF